MLKIKHYEFYEIGMRMSLEFISPGMAPATRSYHYVLYISKWESLHSLIHQWQVLPLCSLYFETGIFTFYDTFRWCKSLVSEKRENVVKSFSTEQCRLIDSQNYNVVNISQVTLVTLVLGCADPNLCVVICITTDIAQNIIAQIVQLSSWTLIRLRLWL